MLGLAIIFCLLALVVLGLQVLWFAVRAAWDLVRLLCLFLSLPRKLN